MTKPIDDAAAGSADGAAGGRQQVIEDLFEEVRGLPEAEREPRLAAAQVPEDVRAEVRSLLSFDGETVHATRQRRDGFASFDPAACIGVTVDGFTIRAVIGSGGMGTVFEAEQERPQRRVALKVLGSAGVRPSAVRRFLQESEFLARLDHPNVARVIAAGTLRGVDGVERPYFAMELVDGGRPITRWAKETNATREEILVKFAEACDAVGTGHRSGIAHLDLKPSNLLVGGDGRVRVIDFGIARSLDGVDRAAHAPAAAGPEAATPAPPRDFAGTPQYMSPEQFSRDGRAVDSRADVYALGLMLYELVTGRLPYETRGLGLKSVARLVADSEPPAPRLVDAHVPRDLDAIVRRAIAKSPDARYGTASEIGDDIRRMLADEPIVAAPATRVDGILRFMRKNRALTALAILTLAVSTIGAVVSTSAAVEAERRAGESARTASLANLRAATAALREGDPAEAARLLDRVRPGDCGWESRHLLASVARHELLAHVGSEILHLAVAGETGEIACGVTSGFVVIVDPKRPEPYEIHDLRAEFGDFQNKYFPSMAISANGRRVLAPLGNGRIMELDRDRGTWRALGVTGPWCADADGATVVVDGGTIMLVPPGGDAPSARVGLGHGALACGIARGARHAAVLCANGDVAMYDLDPAAGTIVERWRTPGVFRRPRAITIADDGSAVVAVSRDPEIVRLDGRDGRIERRAELAGGAVFELAFARGGDTVAASSWANTIRVIDAETLGIRELLGGTLGHVWGIDYAPDDSRIIGRVVVKRPKPVGGDENVEWLGTYRIERPGGTRDFDLGRDVVAATFDAEKRLFWIVDVDGTLGTVRPDEGAFEPIAPVGGDARRLAISGNSIYVGTSGGAVARFDVGDEGSLAERWRTQVYGTPITTIGPSPDGRSIACGTRDRACVLLDAETGDERWRRALPAGMGGPERQQVSYFAYVDDGRAIVPFSVDTEAHMPVLSVADGRELRVYSPDLPEVEAVVPAPGGRFVGAGVTGGVFTFAEGERWGAADVARNGGMLATIPNAVADLRADEVRYLLAARDGLLRVVTIDPDVGMDARQRLKSVEDLMRLDLPVGTALAVGFDEARDEVVVVSNRGRVRAWTGRVDPATQPRHDDGQLQALKRSEADRGVGK
jgi:hypothetical protein